MPCLASWIKSKLLFAFVATGSAEAANKKAKRRHHANIEYEEEHEYQNAQQPQLQ